jgi:hypothetical protein
MDEISYETTDNPAAGIAAVVDDGLESANVAFVHWPVLRDRGRAKSSAVPLGVPGARAAKSKKSGWPPPIVGTELDAV